MKLIIDIDEDIYKMVCITGTFGRFRYNTAKAIKAGIPLEDIKVEIQNTILEQTYEKGQIDVLEKIKAEIKEKQNNYTDRWIMGVTDYFYGCYRGYEETIKVIDNHISELKEGAE